ncbi:hypothetical protein PHET_06350 [Paragonimus heterotremus]|uniref:Secreted protein n=1 Tax=Paragonimus heterotremus TaxID=100268 RepID=A0A8J4WYP8_9TREM|nr:hypothetical protein PHET_06350 [Paragonimus heterotremus]
MRLNLLKRIEVLCLNLFSLCFHGWREPTTLVQFLWKTGKVHPNWNVPIFPPFFKKGDGKSRSNYGVCRTHATYESHYAARSKLLREPNTEGTGRLELGRC